MQLEPKDLYEKLEFDKVIELLGKECYGALGKEAVKHLPIMTDVASIERCLNETWEYKITIEQSDHFPLSAYEDIAGDLKYLHIEDYVLPEDAWRRILRVLLITGDIFRFFDKDRKEIYPHLFDIIRPIDYDKTLAKAIQQVFDDEGNVRPNASPALSKIRSQIIGRQRDMDKVFRILIQEYRNKGWLSDNVESIRNGRRVFSVPAEHKRKIRGIIHDESSTGRTAFIEPEAVININNDVFDLQQEERREIWRILKELSATFRPYVEQVATWMNLLVRLDVIYAKARLGTQMNAFVPRLKKSGDGSISPSGGRGEELLKQAGGVPPPNPLQRGKVTPPKGTVATPKGIPHFGIEMGRHPLLFLKNKKEGKEVVPFDFTLIGANRIVVVSGPNAGGKSILMKSIGLLQIMMQSGMLVPMDEISEMGVFHKIFADIGDQQSIEDDLSTYSSRLANMRTFLRHADKNSLILIDEFGSGTDPKMGGAIAEAILKDLNERGVHGVITTHYSNLKMFAFKNKGIVNGSMLFDKEHLTPTYLFKIGRPGSSYAFEIAQNSGLPKKIIQYARRRTGKNEIAVDELLIDLQREKLEITEKLQSVVDKEKKLKRLISIYDELQRDMEFRRKKQKLEAKQSALQHTAREDKELQKLIREIRENQNLDQAKELSVHLKGERKKLEKNVTELNDSIYDIPLPTSQKGSATKDGPIEKGDFVKMRAGSAIGEVISVDRKKAIIEIGQLRMTVKLRDLIHANAPLEVNNKPAIKADMLTNGANFDSKLDIRGMTMTDAMSIVEDFMDRALLTSANSLEIIHGKGSGALRQVVRQKLREYREIKRMYHPAPKDGGDGVTLVEM